MTVSDRHARLTELLAQFRDTGASTQPDRIREACGGDTGLEAELLALLAAEPAAGFLTTPDLRPGLDADDPGHPDRVGDYEVLGPIGSGGMGIVYEARQRNPARRVALKVLRPGLASPLAIRRFEFEARVLGRLRHAGIAQIHEAGTFEHDGAPRPFVAMELVEGIPVDRYAETHGLDTADRLALVASIAEAVHYAHTRGVVHRDLKPANILVEPDGQAKILDFGVARVTERDDTEPLTSPGRLIGTPEYMSPEQIAGSGDAVDPRSDVYALGVILYELLAGRAPIPFDDVSLLEVARRVGEQEPVPLSTHDRRLRGDIETITLKCLAKERERRYQSALELAVDLRHFLAREPITARPSTLAYQLGTFARRNRGLVAAVLVAMLVLVAGTGATAWQAIAKSREARKSETVRRFLEDVLLLADPEVARGRAYSLREAVDEVAAAEWDDLADHPDVAEELHLTLARIYGRLAEWERAAEQQEAVLAIRRARDGDPSASVARSLSSMANIEYARHDYERCLDLCGQAREMQLALLGRRHQDTAYTTGLMGQAHFRQGDLTTAETLLREAIEMQAAAGDRGLRHANTLNFLAYVLKERGATGEALPFYEQALAIRRRRAGEETQEVAASINNIGMLHLAAGRLADAETMLTDALDRRTRLLGAEHPLAAHGRRNVARVRLARGDYAEAEILIRSVIDQAPWPSLDVDRVILARALHGQGRWDEAAALAEQAADGLAATFDARHPERAEALDRLAAILTDHGDLAGAEAAANEAVAIRTDRLGPGHPVTLVSRSRVARVAVERDDLDDAAAHYLEIERAASADGFAHWERARWLLDFAECEHRRGRDAEAVRLVAAARDITNAVLPPSHPLHERASAIERAAAGES